MHSSHYIVLYQFYFVLFVALNGTIDYLVIFTIQYDDIKL